MERRPRSLSGTTSLHQSKHELRGRPDFCLRPQACVADRPSDDPFRRRAATRRDDRVGDTPIIRIRASRRASALATPPRRSGLGRHAPRRWYRVGGPGTECGYRTAAALRRQSGSRLIERRGMPYSRTVNHDPRHARDTSDPDLNTLYEGVPPWMVPGLMWWLEPFLVSSDDLGERFPIPEFIEGLESSTRLSPPLDRGDVMTEVGGELSRTPTSGSVPSVTRSARCTSSVRRHTKSPIRGFER
jgi:hypothetical protein